MSQARPLIQTESTHHPHSPSDSPHPNAIDAEEFRKGLRAFSTGVAIITVRKGSSLHGMTASSFAAVSVDPQLILFSIALTANAHPLLLEADRFGVNLLQASQAELAHYFAGRRAGQWIEPDYEWVEGCPILKDTLGYFACKKWASYPGGDHTIFVGQPMRIGRSDAPALVCSRGVFHHLGPAIDTPHPAVPDALA